MKETILDVLLYLFEHYFHDDAAAAGDRESQQADLIEAGFAPADIHRAFEWLDELARQRPGPGGPVPSAGPVRVYAEPELARLDADCRGFLLFLEQTGVLDAQQRELVIDRAMALDQDSLDLDDLKWVVLMVLFNQPGSEAAFAWMEGLLFEDEGGRAH